MKGRRDAVPVTVVGQVSRFTRWLVDYDLPADYRRKRFYRRIGHYLAKMGLEETGWSTGSVVWSESESFAREVYRQAKAVGGTAHIWRAERVTG